MANALAFGSSRFEIKQQSDISGRPEQSSLSVRGMKFDLLVRIVALIAGLTVVGFSFWTFSEGRLGRFACVALAGTGVVLVVAVLVSNRLRPADLSKLRSELQEVRREVAAQQEDVAARQEEVKRLTTALSEVLIVVGRWAARDQVEPVEMQKWKQHRLLQAIGHAAPSTENKNHMFRFVRLIDEVDSTTGEEHQSACAKLLEAFRAEYEST
jgi:hypothetical protein